MTLPDLARFDRVAIDTETDGLGYRNRPVGLSWATPDGQSGYLGWGHERGTKNCSLEEVRDWARVELTRPHQIKVMHNAPFDLRMLAYVGIDVVNVEDTMVAAAVLNELEPAFSLSALAKKYIHEGKSDQELNEWCALSFGGQPTRRDQAKNYWRAPMKVVGPYACGDTVLTLGLYDHLRPKVTAEGLDEIYALETAIIPIVVEMHLTGVRVDLDAAHALDASLTTRIDALTAAWHGLAGDVDAFSTQQVSALFRTKGLAVEVTAKGNPSVTADALARIKHPLASTLLELRKLTKHRDLFVRTYVLENADETGVVHGEFHALRSDDFGAVSGRFSSGLSGGSLNLQNLPSKDEELAAAIRGLFVPYYKGWQWGKLDYSQIEFRFLAHYAALLGHTAIAEAYRSNPDVDFHQLCADLTGVARGPAKGINFGLVYGMGQKKLAKTLGLSESEGEALMRSYHSKLPAVRATYDRLSLRANAKGQIRTWGGRVRRFVPASDARARGWSVRDAERYVGTHKALNALLQGSAADLIKRAMVAVRPIYKAAGCPLHLTVHDELCLSVPPGDEGLRVVRDVKAAMENFQLEVPIRVDGAIGPNWGNTSDLPEEAQCRAA